jgi:hypothetical protein
LCHSPVQLLAGTVAYVCGTMTRLSQSSFSHSTAQLTSLELNLKLPSSLLGVSCCCQQAAAFQLCCTSPLTLPPLRCAIMLGAAAQRVSTLAPLLTWRASHALSCLLSCCSLLESCRLHQVASCPLRQGEHRPSTVIVLRHSMLCYCRGLGGHRSRPMASCSPPCGVCYPVLPLRFCCRVLVSRCLLQMASCCCGGLLGVAWLLLQLEDGCCCWTRAQNGRWAILLGCHTK